jgi:hypothetical protein
LVRFAGNSGRFGGRGRVQISLRRAAVSRTLRPTRSLVGLFVSGGDTGRQRARSPTGESYGHRRPGRRDSFRARRQHPGGKHRRIAAGQTLRIATCRGRAAARRGHRGPV